MSCGTNLTESCTDLLLAFRLGRPLETEDLVQNFISISVETALYSEPVTNASACTIVLTRMTLALSITCFSASTYLLCERVVIYPDMPAPLVYLCSVWRPRSKGILIRVNLALWSASVIMFAVSTVHYGLNWAITLIDHSAQLHNDYVNWALFDGNADANGSGYRVVPEKNIANIVPVPSRYQCEFPSMFRSSSAMKMTSTLSMS